MHTKRYGIYYAPATNSELWQLGCQWLGRDCADGKTYIQPQVPNLSGKTLQDFTVAPTRYGFHATLKPPFRLARGQTASGLKQQLSHFAKTHVPVEIGPIKIAAIGRFLALVPLSQSDELTRLAAACVKYFDPFRAPMSEERRAERMAVGLSARQVELLDRWGYPYVMDQFRLHMTLSDSLPHEAGPAVLKAANKWFGEEVTKPLKLDRICLFEEVGRGSPFKRIADFALNADATSKLSDQR